MNLTWDDDREGGLTLLNFWEDCVGGAPTDTLVDHIVFQHALIVNAAMEDDVESARYLSEDAFVGLGIARMFFGLMAWARDGFPTYRLGTNLVRRLMTVDRSAEPLSALDFPYPSFRIVLPGPNYAFQHVEADKRMPVGGLHVYTNRGPRWQRDEKKLVSAVSAVGYEWEKTHGRQSKTEAEVHDRARSLFQVITAKGDEVMRTIEQGRQVTLRFEPVARHSTSMFETFFLDGKVTNLTIGERFAEIDANRAETDPPRVGLNTADEAVQMHRKQGAAAWRLVVAAAQYLTGREPPGKSVRSQPISIPNRRVPVAPKVWNVT